MKLALGRLGWLGVGKVWDGPGVGWPRSGVDKLWGMQGVRWTRCGVDQVLGGPGVGWTRCGVDQVSGGPVLGGPGVEASRKEDFVFPNLEEFHGLP